VISSMTLSPPNCLAMPFKERMIESFIIFTDPIHLF
jgi:hypothetical protein